MPETVKTLKETIEAYLSEIYQDKHADTIAYEITEIIEKWLKQKKQTLENDMVSTSELAKVGLIDDLIAELAI